MRDDTFQDPIQDAAREQVSALMDDELEPDSTQFILSRLGHDTRLRATLDRYQLIRDCLRDQGRRMPDGDRVRRGVRQALAHSPTPRLARNRRAWLKPLGGVAVAASVAMMTLVGVERMRQPALDGVGSARTASHTPTSPAPVQSPVLDNVTAPYGSNMASIQPVAHTQVLPARLNQYLRGGGAGQVVDGQQSVRYIYLVRPEKGAQAAQTPTRP